MRIVGAKATRSIPTAITTEIVGSLVRIHGISPKRAIIKNIVSIGLIFLNPYRIEKTKIIIVNISEAAVGRAPTPAPRAICPKKTIHETIDHTSQV